MSTLLYGLAGPVPVAEEEVRSTVTVVDGNDPPAVQEHSPDFNETFVDPDTGGGLTSRQVASHVVPSMRYAPHLPGVYQSSNAIINEQVASSGTAAGREASGEWGHGTLQIVEGIEPTVRDGAQLGADYFTAGQHDVGKASGSYMTPSQAADPTTRQDATAAATIAGERAAKANMYAAYLAAQTGN